MRKAKLEIDQKIYIVFGDPERQIILSGKVFGVTMTRFQLYYTYDNIKVVKCGNKDPKKFAENLIKVGSVDDEFVDMKNGKPISTFGMHNWPVFTSKELCINYLRRFKK